MVPPLAGIIQKAVAGGAVTFLNAWLKELLPVGWVRYDKRVAFQGLSGWRIQCASSLADAKAWEPLGDTSQLAVILGRNSEKLR
jgi:hypothetical protein